MIAERITESHIFFWGGIFSQWCRCEFQEDGQTFTSAEQYMMYHKAKAFNDFGTMHSVMNTNDPKTQKALGRQIKGYSDEVWAPIRYQTVVQGNYLKFTQDDDLKRMLFGTANKIIVEASPYDKIWGIGLGPHDDRVLNEANWDGQNLLGKAIMEVRDRIRFENRIFLT